MAQRALPSIASWVEESVTRLLAEQNLTDALRDARVAYETLQGPRHCSRREQTSLVVRLSKAEVALSEAVEAETRLGTQLRAGEANLFAEVASLVSAQRSAVSKSGTEAAALLDKEIGKRAEETDQQRINIIASEEPRNHQKTTTEMPSNPKPSSAALTTQRRVVALDAEVSKTRAAHAVAAQQLLAAEHEVEQASAHLSVCLPQDGGVTSGTPGSANYNTVSSDGKPSSDIGPRLKAAYSSLWHGHVVEAVSELRSAASGASSALAKAALTADSTMLPRLAAAALAPLRLVARVALGSVGSTAATAMMGGLGVIRIGVGLVKAGIQAMLFLALLYYLLAAPRDPLDKAIGVLPLSDAGRSRATLELNQSLSGRQ